MRVSTSEYILLVKSGVFSSIATEDVLNTKLYIPRTRPEIVSRPRLINQLNDGLYRKLTLISAPAGFGKTTLISEWVEEIGADGYSEDAVGAVAVAKALLVAKAL